MSWSKQQIAAAHIAKSQIGWQEPQYRLILRNVAGIREFLGKVSSKNPTATNAGFERFMTFCEKAGFIDQRNGPGHWTARAQDQYKTMRFKIIELADRAHRHGIIAGEFLPAYVERMTATRPQEQGGPTRALEECDGEYLYKVIEGLKAWVSREARIKGITLDE